MCRAPFGPFRLVVLAILLATGLAACGDDNTTPITPTTPTTPTVTETFTGTLTVNGAATFPFAASRSGIITATLTTLGPDSTVVLGLSLGTWNGAVCQIILANDKATQASTVTGTANSLGAFCVRIYDVGNLTQAMDYEIQVVHP